MITNTDTVNEADAIAKRMVWRNPLVWLEGFTKILIDEVAKRFTANILQRRLVQVVLWCLKHSIPIRIVVLKPRQRGISTITMGVLAWLMIRFPMRCAILGGLAEQAANLYTILKTYLENDEFAWGIGAKILDDETSFENGSRCRPASADGKAPLRSGTYQVLVCTEVAYWGKDGRVRAGGKVFGAAMACVKLIPKSFVVVESTSAGPQGVFYRQWEDAITFEELQRDPVGNAGKFVRVFAGVFEFPEVSDPCTPDEARDILQGIGARNETERVREQRLIRRYGLKAGQIKAYRRLLRECDNDPQQRDLEYPVVPEDAWQAGSLRRFNNEGLRVMRHYAEQAAHDLHYGVLERMHDGQPFTFRRIVDDVASAEVVIAEYPRAKARYIVIVDTMKGRATDEKRRKLDAHAVGVLREGFFDAHGAWVTPKVVATVTRNNQSEPFQIGQLTLELSEFYGRCPIVVEANNDPGVIPYLRSKGANLWTEKKVASDARNAGDGTGRYGFWMSDNADQKGVRGQIISTLAQAVIQMAADQLNAGEGIDVPFLWIIEEMEKFVRDPDTGKSEALAGEHDDWVMMLCMGMATMSAGSIYAPPVQHLMAPGQGVVSPTYGQSMPGMLAESGERA